MKRKILLLSATAILGLASLVACGPTISSSETPSVPETSVPGPTTEVTTTTGEVTTEDTSTSTPAPEIVISVTAAKSEITVGEQTKLTIGIENAAASAQVQIATSNPEVLGVYQNPEDRGIYAIGLGSGTADIVVAVGEKSSKVTITVTALEGKGAPAKKAIEDSIAVCIPGEATYLKDGTYTEKTVKADGTVTTDQETTFEVFSDNFVKVDTVKKGTKPTTINSFYGLHNNEVVIYSTETEGETTTETSKSKVKSIGENADFTAEEAQVYVSQVDIPVFGLKSSSGVLNYILNSKIKKAKPYTDATLVETGVTTFESLTHVTYKNAGKQAYGTYSEIEIDLHVHPKVDVATAVTFTKKDYKLVNETEKGELTYTTTISATLNVGQRVASTDGQTKLAGLYYTDYTPILAVDKYSEASTEAMVGDTLYVVAKNPAPATASAKIDKVKIKSVTPNNVATIDDNGQSLTFTAAAETATVTTVSSKGVEKTTTIKVKEAAISSIEINDLPATINLGEPAYFSVYVNPDNLTEVAGLQVTLTNVSEGCDATIQDVGYGTYMLSATTAGTATVKVTSALYKDEAGNPIPVTQDVTFAEAVVTPESIAAILTSNDFSMSTAGETDYLVFMQSLETYETNQGTFELTMNGENASGTFEIALDPDTNTYVMNIVQDAEGQQISGLTMSFFTDPDTMEQDFLHIIIAGTSIQYNEPTQGTARSFAFGF